MIPCLPAPKEIPVWFFNHFNHFFIWFQKKNQKATQGHNLDEGHMCINQHKIYLQNVREREAGTSDYFSKYFKGRPQLCTVYLCVHTPITTDMVEHFFALYSGISTQV